MKVEQIANRRKTDQRTEKMERSGYIACIYLGRYGINLANVETIHYAPHHEKNEAPLLFVDPHIEENKDFQVASILRKLCLE